MRSCPARSRSAGSRLPGARRPTRIAVPSRSTVSSKVVGVRTGSKIAFVAALRSIPLSKVLPVVLSMRQ